MEKIEEKIRDKLIHCLHILDDNLTFIEKEFFLPNDQGTRGFVDILAKDALNRYLLIELKRSKAASREAIHEILKYIEGIKEKKSLKNDEIVAFIVSTEWDELLIPFSSFVQDMPYSVLGYKLIVDDNLNPISAEKVTPIKLNNERLLGHTHKISFYANKDNLNKGITSHFDFFSRKNIQDYVLLILNTTASNFGVSAYDYMIYSAVQLMDRERYLSILKTDKCVYEELRDNLDSYSLEELHGDAIDDFDESLFKEDYEIGYPSKLSSILNNQGWEIEKIIRKGKLKETKQPPAKARWV